MTDKRKTIRIYGNKVTGRICATHRGAFWQDGYKRCSWHKLAPEIECLPQREEIHENIN